MWYNQILLSCQKWIQPYNQKLPAVMEMYDAYDADHQEVYAFKASGKVSGAFINIYPPGIPLVVPGEIMNDKLIDDVIKAVNSVLKWTVCTLIRMPICGSLLRCCKQQFDIANNHIYTNYNIKRFTDG